MNAVKGFIEIDKVNYYWLLEFNTIMFHNVKFCSLQEHPCWNPTFSSSIASGPLPSETATEKRYTETYQGLWGWGCLSSCCSQTHWLCQNLFSKLLSFCIIAAPHCFRSSAGIWSIPGALLFFSERMAFSTSAVDFEPRLGMGNFGPGLLSCRILFQP